jgi:beta-glucuronidase
MVATHLLLFALWCSAVQGLLYPYVTETRKVKSLDSLWSFRLDEQGCGETERWFALPQLPEPTIFMPVPASYNDITQNISIHQYIGWVWYARDFFVHETAGRWVLRFQAANYETRVWINGQSAMNHSGGHLPFECDINPFIAASGGLPFRVHIVVAVDNTLTISTLPPGEVHIVSDTYRYVETAFDFFNYAGIDRSVLLYSTSSVFIEDISIETEEIEYNSNHVATKAVLTYLVTIGNVRNVSTRILIQLLDADGIVVVNSTDYSSQLTITNPHLWEPCGMNHTHPCSEQSYLYTLQVFLYQDTSIIPIDIYRIPHVGIRTVRLTNSQFLVNERPFYFHGANAHEDSDIRGKGFDRVLLAKHFNLYAWLHGNSFRTSHYPYADEFYEMADRYGLAVIDEVPAVGVRKAEYFNQATLQHHKQVTTEMIMRDRNHPSVLMWSLANEPASFLKESRDYFEAIVKFTRPIASKRPLTLVTLSDFDDDVAAPFFDMICINRYYSWYDQYGRLDQISMRMSQNLANWRKTYPTKPLLMSEYGADAVPGLHHSPAFMFTEEYQQEFLAAYQVSFDNVSSLIHPDTGYFVGELVWNMFDFATEQDVKRVAGLNYKGLFTRQRQPKSAAFTLKRRYEQLEQVPTGNPGVSRAGGSPYANLWKFCLFYWMIYKVSETFSK